MIIELADSMREQVVSAATLTEAASMARSLNYTFYLIETYELTLPIVEGVPKKFVSNGMPHSLQVQAI